MPARSRRRRGHLARAFTLVEMLVAMVLTLIMVAAIAEFYARVGESVKDGRASIEMSASLRTAVQRLKSDLDLVTLPFSPWTDDSGGWGYLEIFEGSNTNAASDADVDGDGTIDAAAGSPWLNDANTDGVTDYENQGITSLLGDGDDYIAMTIRASGEPLTGRHVNPTTTVSEIVKALHAEVIWWVGFDDLDGDGGWDLNEPRQIYRRQLLIRPDAGQIGVDYPFTQNGWRDVQRYLREWWQVNDVSASIRREVDNSGNDVLRIRANSLTDLSRRERRFAHLAFRVDTSGNLVDNFPYPQNLLTAPAANRPLGSLSANSPNVSVAQVNAADRPSYALQAMAGTAQAEDIVVSNVLAMDIRVYDQNAPIRADVPQNNLDTDAVSGLIPGDPGYLYAAATSYPVIGLGAYVDLGYGDVLFQQLQAAPYNMTPANARTAVGSGYFAGQSKYLTQLGHTYDTWSLSYERDGINQDNDTITVGMMTQQLIDEGTNGLDDDNVNGVDDVGERETQPPFPKALRGVQVWIRVYEPGTRQMKQATVIGDSIQE